MDNTLIEWDDFSPTSYDPDYQDTNIKCPRCGEPLKKYVRMVLCSYPPKYRYDCFKCGWSGAK